MANTQLTEKKLDFRSVVQKTADAYMPLIAQQLAGQNAALDSYQRQCMSNALVMLNEAAIASGSDLSALPKTDVMQIMQQTATLRLNAFSQPREVYFTTRKKKQSDGSWGVSAEMGIEGDGNDAILRNFGHDVAEVYPYWAVREGDGFSYPKYKGIEVEPPEWEPKGSGKYIRVVYPIKYKDGTVRYFIAERADVRDNLVAHISNNMMNETFGIAETRYKATLDEKKRIEARKEELLGLCSGKDIDEILEIPELAPYISPAWSGANRERMILRKMRNNCVKPIPKDFATPSSAAMYARISDDAIDAEYREVPEAQPVTVASPEISAPVEASAEPQRTKAAEAPF